MQISHESQSHEEATTSACEDIEAQQATTLVFELRQTYQFGSAL